MDVQRSISTASRGRHDISRKKKLDTFFPSFLFRGEGRWWRGRGGCGAREGLLVKSRGRRRTGDFSAVRVAGGHYRRRRRRRRRRRVADNTVRRRERALANRHESFARSFFTLARRRRRSSGAFIHYAADANVVVLAPSAVMRAALEGEDSHF